MIRHFTFLLAVAAIVLTAAGQSPTIVGYEYWFDQNDGARTYVPVAPAQTVNLSNAPLNTSGLSLGPHVVNLRWKDQGPGGAKRWSSVVTRALQMGQPGPWEIVAVRYWVGSPASDAEPLIRYKYFDTPQTVLTYSGPLELCDYPTGAQELKLQLLDNHGQWSSVVTRPVVIDAAGSLGTPSITASASTFCPGDVVTFTANPQLGSGFATPTGFNWQVPSGNGWSALPSDSSSIVVTIGDVSGIVQAAATNYCGMGAYGSLNVTLPAVPDQVPFISGPLQACIGSDAVYSTPAVPGVSYIWSVTGGWTAEGGPEASISTLVGASNASISVIAQNACGVQAPPRIEAITVTAPPYAGIDGSLSICSDSTPISLSMGLQGTPDAGGVWRRNGVIVPGIYNPAVDEPGVYTYTVSGSGPCPDATATVTVIEQQAPNAGADGALTLCSNDAPLVMTDALGGNPDAGGSWSGPSPTAGSFNPSTMNGGVYTYTVNGTAPCANASATLTISVQQAPNAGAGGTLELCEGTSPVALINSLTGGPALSGSWAGPDGQPFAGIFTPGQDTEGAYTYTVQGAGVCPNASAVLLVNVMDLEITGIDGPLSVPFLETLTYAALPALTDADSVVWTLPAGWEWAADDLDPYDAVARVVPPAQAMVASLCAQAFGGGCAGNEVCVTVDVTVGVERREGEAAVVSVFPNPSAGMFMIRTGAPDLLVEVRVHDASGRVVAEPAIVPGTTAMVDLSALASGRYLLWLRSAEHAFVRPIAITR